jgi:hypothetical protein
MIPTLLIIGMVVFVISVTIAAFEAPAVYWRRRAQAYAQQRDEWRERALRAERHRDYARKTLDSLHKRGMIRAEWPVERGL